MPDRRDSSVLPKQQSTLQKILTSAVNEIGMEAALVAIMTHDGGPLIEQVSRGFSTRETRAILRALSLEELKAATRKIPQGDQNSTVSFVCEWSHRAAKLPLCCR